MWEMGYLTGLHVRLGAKIGDRHAKDSNAFRKQQIKRNKQPLKLRRIDGSTGRRRTRVR